ncbi:unnamed protein product [Durusdinium trenchii]|uniref:Ribosomal RNA-processing protein 14/surfeit locus protein 6 C-terminal domain-containing protein n=1 Tax=Durusdinium trenchii TaxID=1381693 RepID=A0ABP0NN83_9DINO
MIGNGTGLIWFGDSSLLSIAPGEKASSRSPKTGGSSLIGFGSNSFLMQNACTPGAAQAQALKLKEAESQGRGEDVRKAEKSTEFAYQKALQRARGEKVHDDVSKLRKVQKTMEMKKKKGQERWEAKIESDKQKVQSSVTLRW